MDFIQKVRLSLSKKNHLKDKRASRAVICGKSAPGGGNSQGKGLQAGRGPGVVTNRKTKRRPTLCCVKNSSPGDTGECRLVQPLQRTAGRFLKKLKIELSYDPAIPFLGIYPQKTIIQKDACTCAHSSTIYSRQDVGAT